MMDAENTIRIERFRHALKAVKQCVKSTKRSVITRVNVKVFLVQLSLVNEVCKNGSHEKEHRDICSPFA